MERPPRTLKSHMITFRRFIVAFFQGASICLFSLLSYWVSKNVLNNSSEESNAIAFGTTIMGNLGLLVVNRSEVSICSHVVNGAVPPLWCVCLRACDLTEAVGGMQEHSCFTHLKTKNTALVVVTGISMVALVLALFVPVFQDLFHFAPLGFGDVMWFVGGGVLSVSWYEVYKYINRCRSPEKKAPQEMETLRSPVRDMVEVGTQT